MADLVSIGAAIGAGFASIIAGFSHVNTKKIKKDDGSISSREIKRLESQVEKLDGKVEGLSKQLSKIERSLGRLEGRSEADKDDPDG